MTEQQSMLANRERLSQGQSRVLGWALWQLVRPVARLDEESRQNLMNLDQHLETASAVVYGYHGKKIDAVLAPLVYRSYLSNLNRGILPVGRDQYQGKQAAWFRLMGSTMRIHGMPVVREGHPKDQPFLHEKDELLDALKDETAIGLMAQGYIYGVAPPGTRVKHLVKPTKDSFARLGERFPNVGYQPAALYFEGLKYMIRIGGMVMNEEMEGMSTGERVEHLMLEVARLLPEQLQGDYQGLVTG